MPNPNYGTHAMPPMIALCLAALLGFGSSPALGQDRMLLDDFAAPAQGDWRFISDTVMGGISQGEARILREGTATFARMTGQVSTANNGGFIQMRLDLPNAAPVGTEGVRLVMRGNNARYYIHLRTAGTVLPWQYYQAGFDSRQNWTEIRLPLSSFQPSSAVLRRVPQARSLRSIAVVAFGRDHQAAIDILEIGFY